MGRRRLLHLPPRVHGERHYSIRRRAGEGIDGYALASTGAIPAEAGRSYRASFSARPEAGVRPALARAELFFLNAGGYELARRYGPWARETSAPDWRRVPEVSAQAPAGTASVVMHMAWSETLDGQWHNADAAMLEAVCAEGCASRWTKSARRYVNTVATDDGLGANRIRLSRAARTGDTATDYRTHPCAGNRFDYCPAPYNRDGVGFNQTFQINTDDLPEGSTDLNATTTDVTDNDSTQPALPTMKVDRTSPVLPIRAVWATPSERAQSFSTTAPTRFVSTLSTETPRPRRANGREPYDCACLSMGTPSQQSTDSKLAPAQKAVALCQRTSSLTRPRTVAAITSSVLSRPMRLATKARSETGRV